MIGLRFTLDRVQSIKLLLRSCPHAANPPMSDPDTPRQAWVVHPLRDNWKRSVILSLFLTLFFSGVYWGFHSASITLLSTVFLIGSLYRYFIPFRYEFYDDRLVVTALFSRLTKPWSVFRSFYIDRNGVLLSPFAKPSRLENFRGVYVRFGGCEAEVVDFIKSKISALPDS